MFRSLWRLCTSILAIALAGAPSAASDIISPELRSVAAAQNEFGFALFHRLLEAVPDANVIVSPTAVYVALTTLYDGAHGPTKAAMRHGMDLGAMSDAALDEGAKSLVQSLSDNTQLTGGLGISDEFWAAKGLSFQSLFEFDCGLKFGTAFDECDFHSTRAEGMVNNWIRTRTNRTISGLVTRLAPDIQLLGTCAAHFDSQWARPFNISNTYDHQFTAGPTSQVLVKMMRSSDRWSYNETPQFQAVRLGYLGQQYYMVVVLPRPGVSLRHLLATLTPQSWKDVDGQMQIERGDVELPRVQTQFGTTLNAPLTDLGMRPLFSNQANLRGMVIRSAKLGEIVHKTNLNISENGSEATDPSKVAMEMSLRPLPHFNMIVDRPFFCAIVDRATGALLYLAAVYNPGRQ